MDEEHVAENGLPVSPPLPGKHDCREALPWRSGGYGSTGYPEGSVALCPSCVRAWVCLPCYQSLGPVTWWRPVWWFSRRDYRQRAAQLRRVIPPGKKEQS